MINMYVGKYFNNEPLYDSHFLLPKGPLAVSSVSCHINGAYNCSGALCQAALPSIIPSWAVPLSSKHVSLPPLAHYHRPSLSPSWPSTWREAPPSVGETALRLCFEVVPSSAWNPHVSSFDSKLASAPSPLFAFVLFSRPFCFCPALGTLLRVVRWVATSG
jgi:hypothetical protein